MREHGASATPRVQRFTQLIAELVHEIFFVPPGFNNVAAGERLDDEESEAEDGIVNLTIPPRIRMVTLPLTSQNRLDRIETWRSSELPE